jgi:sigma-B regulation protein RsbU (phosphoserine phosphatase)
MTTSHSVLGGTFPNWRAKLAYIVETMREMSLQTDPQDTVQTYALRMREVWPSDRMVAISRRDLASPKYRVTRSSLWNERVNPWKQQDRLPLFEGGLMSELIYGDSAQLINRLDIAPDEPAAEYFEGQKSLVAIPLFDSGVAKNMVLFMREEADAYDPEQFPDLVLMTSLFGRMTHNLVLRGELQKAYDAVDREMKTVAEIQRALLPPEMPDIPTMHLAAHYRTSKRAGGDYYDFFPVGDGKWGILIADASGHGTPAAVVMAITHSIVHTHPGPPTPPSEMLNFINHHLASRYTEQNGSFVTAFYGIYDPEKRRLMYASAGHPPPRLKRCEGGRICSLDEAREIPLGVSKDARYHNAEHQLHAGDQIVFYTDGINEAFNPDGEQFGLDRLDAVMERCRHQAGDLIQAIVSAVDEFAYGLAAEDDQTLLVAKIS